MNSVDYLLKPIEPERLDRALDKIERFAGQPRPDVRAIAVDGRVRVSVDDDGPGFDATLRPEGHGLDLLAGRLKMLFGERASLQIDSRTGSTSVTVDVPSDGPAEAGHYVR